MACRIGITTDRVERERHWRNKYPSLQNWQILMEGLSKEEAQNQENLLKDIYGCEAHAGGPDTSGDWCVYKFDY